MGSIGTALTKLILEVALAAFSHFLSDMLKAYQAKQSEREKGRLDAAVAQATAGRDAAQRMDAVGDDFDIRQALKEGRA